MKLFELGARPVGGRPPLELQKKNWLKEFIKPFSVMFLVYMAMYIMRNAFKGTVGPSLIQDGGLSKAVYGDICFYGGVCYGIGKAVLGFLADGKNTKKLLSFLLALTAVVNIGMGIVLALCGVSTSGLIMFTMFYCLSNLFQSPGGGCSYGTLLRWLPRSQKGKWIGRWNTSHNIGGALGGFIAAHVVATFGTVSSALYVTAGIGIFVALYGWFVGKNSPEELNWDDAATIWGEEKSAADLAEEAEEKKAQAEGRSESKWEIFKKFVAPQKFVWLLCLMNIFVYVVRLGLDGWTPVYVAEHFKTLTKVNTLGWFEIPAMVGSLFWGWLSDKLHGRSMITSMIAFAILGVDMFFLANAKTLQGFLICLAIGGFTVFGPQLLIGVTVVGYVPKKAMVVTNGLTGTAAYLFGEATTKKWLGHKLESSLNIFGFHIEKWNCLWLAIAVSIIIGFILMIIVAINEEKRIKEAQKNRPLITES